MRKFDLIFVLVIALLASFASMSYELLIARFLTSLSSDSVLSQSVTIGTYLLALGIGAQLSNRLKAKSPLATFVYIEIAISLSTAILMHAILWFHLYVESVSPALGVSKGKILIFGSQLVTIWIGTLAGLEIPLLIEALKDKSDRAFGWILGMSYFGGLLASVLVIMYLVPRQGILSASLIVSLATAGIAALVLVRYFLFSPRLGFTVIIAALFLPPYLAMKEPLIQQFYLKSYYYFGPSNWSLQEIKSTLFAHLSLPPVRRITTPYQEIDVVMDNSDDSKESDFFLYIDHRQQFSSVSERLYHDLMIHGSLNVMGREPRHSLIIGGGDGLLVRELLKYSSLESVTVVELDPAMLDLAKTSSLLVNLNKHALSDQKVKVIAADGFEWIKRNRDQFDSIFVDLPHPNSVELARLYSQEFYRFIYNRLSDDGFMTFDFPFYPLLREGKTNKRNLIEAASIYAGVTAAGFKSKRIFGMFESFAVASKKEHEMGFDYEKIQPFVHPMSAADLVFIDDKTLLESNEPPSSVFRPRWVRESFDGN